MKPNHACLCLLLAALALLACPHAFAQTKRLVQVPISDAPAYAKRALVIGVDDYTIAHALTDCGNDARAFADLLKTRFGFEHVTLMTDDPATPKSLQPTGSNLRHQLRLLLDGVVPDKTELVLFYSGHGTRTHDAASGDADWLIPEDGDPGDIARSCVNYSEFKSQLDTARPGRALLVMDACRDLYAGKGVAGSGFGVKSWKPLGPQVAELLSCQPTQVSQEGLEADFHQSVFTHFLIKGLEGDPDALDGATKNVTFDSLKVYVQGQVSQYVSDKFNASQVPDGRATLGSMVLAHVGDLPRGVTLPSLPPQTPDIPAAPQLTPAQQQANARLVGIWMHDEGTNDLERGGSLTLAAAQQALDAGADVNAKDYSGGTALMVAAGKGRADVVRLLLDKGADAKIKEMNDWTALHDAVCSTNVDVVRLLLDKGADINAKQIDGFTPLMYAAWYGSADIVRLLLARGAGVNLKGNDGENALDMAHRQKHDDVAAMLKAAGAKE